MTTFRIRGISGVAVLVAALAGSSCEQTARPVPADRLSPTGAAEDVRLTWLSVTNWVLEAGETRILFDGYVSRIDRTTVNADGTSTAPAPPDDAWVGRVRDAVFPAGGPDWILVGHGHWDHAFDTPSWARLSQARMGGARTVCHEASAFGIPASRCMAFEGGESFEAGPGVRVRVVRWAHSGDSTRANDRLLRAPLELRGPPRVDDATGGLRPGYLEDYPNGGGARAWLITVTTTTGPVTLFWSNTGNPQAWDSVVPADSVFFREQGIDLSNLEWAVAPVPARDALAAALREEGLDGVDLWIGAAGIDHVRQVSSVLHPHTFVPNHWDDFWTPLADGVNREFRRAAIEPFLEQANTRLLVTPNYFDGFRLSTSGAEFVDGAILRRRLGIRDSGAR